MALLDDVRNTFFLKSTVTDDVLTLHIDTALAELRRVGIRQDVLADEENLDPLIKGYVVAYVHTRYDPTGSIAPHWVAAFKQAEIDLMHSDLSTYFYEGEVGGDGASGGLGAGLGSSLGSASGGD